MTDAGALLAEVRGELARFVEFLPLLVAGLDDAAWRARPQPHEWSPLEILCHLRDEEELDFGARFRVVLEGGERFAFNDPERLAVTRRYREADPAEALAAFVRLRLASLELLAAAPPDRLARSALRPSGERLSGLDVLASWVAHDRLHLQQLAGTLARIWADRWAPLDVGYAGPIPYEGPRAG
ncbi:MAG TPA: DinB family protein [Methylomirabilota bacterium]|nr:DinB family protein [Methylomirabilota bacterium]